MAKPVDQLTASELLRDLADTLQWPRWFDTDEGERYAEAVRPRLLQMANEIDADRSATVVAVIDHRDEVCRCGHVNDVHDEEGDCRAEGCGCGLFMVPVGAP